MYRTTDGEEIFIIDGHVHLWDGSKANLKNVPLVTRFPLNRKGSAWQRSLL